LKTFIPRIVLTAGEPAGIGPDLCALIAQRPFLCDLVAVTDPELLTSRAEILGLSLHCPTVTLSAPPELHRPGTLKVLPTRLQNPTRCGKPSTDNAAFVLKSIKRAAGLCRSGEAHAMVTGPVHKGIINDAEIAFSGHTEYLAELTEGHPVMMLTAPGLRVALATTHLPLAAVSEAITFERIHTVLTVLHRDLISRFSIEQPRIGVCGLNPHAGEGGHLGKEEIEIIEPVLKALNSEGLHAEGPFPADTLLTPDRLEHLDAVLAMYHDQGLPVLKYAGFGQAVNITLGLPIIRTSVDHGTALELAGSGRIRTGSMQAAIQTAIDLSINQARHTG
jgi:4-hydroxythreonine-4-phosphate dehydrogenase